MKGHPARSMRIVVKRYRPRPGAPRTRDSGRARGAVRVGSLLAVAPPGRAAIPVETDHRGVVLEVAPRGVQDRRAELVDDLARVQVRAVGQGGGDVEID